MLRGKCLKSIGIDVEQTPNRNHRVNVLVMQSLEFPRNIREVGVEDRIALRLPPEPILYDRIERDMLLAIVVSNIEYLVLRNVAVFRLKETIRPLGEHGGVARQLAILMNDLLHLMTRHAVVANRA